MSRDRDPEHSRRAEAALEGRKGERSLPCRPPPSLPWKRPWAVTVRPPASKLNPRPILGAPGNARMWREPARVWPWADSPRTARAHLESG